jgi:hypothetical protein
MFIGAVGIIVTAIAGGGTAIASAAGGEVSYGAQAAPYRILRHLTQRRRASDSMPPSGGRIIAPGWDFERVQLT